MLKYLGPGVLLAGAAIGGSHLVTSTQAGANYGWSLLGILLLINLFKYPFFLFAHRYTSATGESLLQGYMRLGRPYLILYFIMSLFTGIVNIAGVSMITGSLATNFGFSNISIPVLSGVIMLICILVIVIGGYPLLKSFGKTIVLVLGVSTLIAMVISLVNGPVAPDGFEGDSPWTIASFGFVIMFMGWMPAPIEVSVWPSLWMITQEQLQKKTIKMREAMIDFHAGYGASVFLALVFLVLGKMIIYGSGTVLSSQGSVFAGQLIELYAATIGSWAAPFIIVAAFSAMLSTSLTTIDAYPRSFASAMVLLFNPLPKNYKLLHHILLVVSGLLGFLIISSYVDRLGDMLSLAMILSFLAAPVYAWLNYRVMFGENVDDKYRPAGWLRLLSVGGIVFLAGFGLVFLYWYFFLSPSVS